MSDAELTWGQIELIHCGGGACVDAYDPVEDGECFCSCKNCTRAQALRVAKMLKEQEK